MLLKRLAHFFFLIFLLSLPACSRKHDFNVSSIRIEDVLGTWTLYSAPDKVMSNFPTNYTPPAKLVLQSNSVAEYYFIPALYEADTRAADPHSLASDWSFETGRSFWDFSNWTNRNTHLSHVGLMTSKGGIQLDVAADSSGKLVLIYNPKPDFPEEVIYHQLLSENEK